VKTLVVAMIVTGVAVVVRPRPPSVRTATGQPSATWTGVGLALGGALLVAAALVSL
jgi:drug/metabolite transporter (DMT)-like permease